MTVRVASDSETDRILSMRASSLIPLPPEVCLADPAESRGYFRMAAFYGAYGLGSHPVVSLLKDERVGSMMASALSRAALMGGSSRASRALRRSIDIGHARLSEGKTLPRVFNAPGKSFSSPLRGPTLFETERISVQGRLRRWQA